MYSKNSVTSIDYSYNNLMYRGQIGFSAKPFEGQSYKKLVDKAEKALSQKQYDNAITNAKIAAIHYGVAGLLLYVNVMTQYLQEQSKQGELVEVPVANMLAFLDFARAMLDNCDTKALKSISLTELDANTYSTDKYWDEKKEQLFALVPESDKHQLIKFEAAATTESLIARCSEPDHPSGYKPVML
jgi:hypothetical protein